MAFFQFSLPNALDTVLGMEIVFRLVRKALWLWDRFLNDMNKYRGRVVHALVPFLIAMEISKSF